MLVEVVLDLGDGLGVGFGVGVGGGGGGGAPFPNSHSPSSWPFRVGSKYANRPVVRSRLPKPQLLHCIA